MEDKKVKINEELGSKEEYLELKKNNEKKKIIIVVLIFVATLFAIMAILSYLGIINNNSNDKNSGTDTNNCQCEKCEKQECQCDNTPTDCNCPKCPNYTGCLGEKISFIKEIKLTDKNQTVKVGKKEYKIRLGTEVSNHSNVDDFYDEYLIINNMMAISNLDSDPISVDHTYVTDKYIIFTADGQRGEWFAYVIGEQDEIHFVFDGNIPSDSRYMNDFHVVDGYLYTDEFLIKYIDNVLLVVDKK